MEESTKKKLLITSIVALILACCGYLGVRVHQNRLHMEAQSSEQQISKAQQSYQHKYNTMRAKLISDKSSSRNKNLQTLSLQNGSVDLAQTMSTRFFKVLTSYSPKNYGQIGDQLKPMATDNVINNKQIYNKDNVEAVKATGLTSSFGGAKVWVESADNNTINYLCEVDNDVSYGDTETHTKTTMYEMKYDKGQQKISDLNIVYVYHN